MLSVLEREYLHYLRVYPHAQILLLIDFDHADNRRSACEVAIPEDLRDRVFVIGSWNEPEDIRRDLHISFERMGTQLADECYRARYDLWTGPHFAHNEAERNRLATALRSILIPVDRPV